MWHPGCSEHCSPVVPSVHVVHVESLGACGLLSSWPSCMWPIHVVRVVFPDAQVVAPLAGNITFAGASRLTCPAGSNIFDSFRGLYGNDGSYPVQSSYCSNPPSSILMSTLSFGCEACGPGLYSLAGGASNGQPGQAALAPCLPCPIGGLCLSGARVSATPGHWGAASNATVSFMVCPTGYCCDGTPSSPCVRMDSCGGGRAGTACGECPSGFVEALGSPRCQRVSRCPRDQAVVWPLVAVAVTVAAMLQLTVVSGVWVTPSGLPSGKMKLAIYFAQVPSPLPVMPTP
jgi:hypothetical protein